MERRIKQLKNILNEEQERNKQTRLEEKEKDPR